MEILDLRQIRSRDLEAVLQEESRLWHEQLRWDYSSSVDLVRRFLDARALTGYAALEQGRPVGYAFFVYEDHKGLIGDLFVSHAYSGGTEGQLLDHVIETMQQTPGIRRIEAQLLAFNADSLEPTFRREHFQVFPRQFMLLELDGVPTLEPRPLAGVALIDWKERHLAGATSLIARAYHGHIDSQINDQYCSNAGAARFLKNIIKYPGCGAFYAPASFLAVHQEAGQVCGLVLGSVVHPDIGHITQVCVAPEFHGAGIGFELVRRSAEVFRRAGFAGLSLTVTSANQQALQLYERMGFQTLKEFSAYVWNASSAYG